jgi:hypothetical protein
MYGLLAISALAARRHERATTYESDDTWSTMWLLVAGFLAASSLGRALDVVGQVGDATRSAAIEDGWYDARRWFQRIVVLAIVGSWSSAVLFAALRTPERRRRYVPIAVGVVTLAAFVLIRAVSLHSVDSVTEHGVGPMDVGIVVEFVFLAVVALGLSVAWRLAVEPHDVTLDLVVAESGVVGRSAGQPASE